MIEDYENKKKEKNVELAFASSGSIAVIEKRFNERTGIPEMLPTQETNSKHIDDLIADQKRQLEPIQNRINDLEALKKDVAAKEKEREDSAKKVSDKK